MSGELQWSTCEVCRDEIGWPADGTTPICYDCLARRVRDLEAAVRWIADENTYAFFDAEDGVVSAKRADFAVDRWLRAHPIVREVIEKRGE